MVLQDSHHQIYALLYRNEKEDMSRIPKKVLLKKVPTIF